jgi:succinate dehydrogenase/fumarate reductase cytochrome b subunit (b558 family)
VTRKRLHSLTGVVPLLGYLLLHAFEASSAARGRDAFVASMRGVGGGSALVLEGIFVLLPLLVHVGLGLSLWVRPAEDADVSYDTEHHRTIQRVSGLLVLAFLAVHASHTLALEFGGADAVQLYEVLRTDLGKPLYLGVYVVGTAALALHLANGLPLAMRRFGLARRPAAQRNAKVAASILSLVLFVATVNTMSHFVVGDAFFGDAPEPSQEAAP